MPDWSYHTLFRPLLFRLPARASRSLTLHAIGAVGRMPGGSFVIRTLGHMEPSPLLERSAGGLKLPTPVGLSGAADPRGTAHRALAQLGFGFIEIGPVTVHEIRCDEPIVHDIARETIHSPSYFENEGAVRVAGRIAEPGHRLPQWIRIAPMPDAAPEEAELQLGEMMSLLAAAGAAGFYVDIASSASRPWEEVMRIKERMPALIKERCGTAVPAFLYVPPDLADDKLEELLRPCEADTFSGGLIWRGAVIGEAAGLAAASRRGAPESGGLPSAEEDGTAASGGSRQAPGDYPVSAGPGGKAFSLAKIKRIRETAGPDFTIKAGAGVHEPQDALEQLEAGADLIVLHSGLVYAGPGFPKRINEAVIYETIRREEEPPTPPFWRNWGWMWLLGVGMIVGGLLAWGIGATRVLLSYDLDFLGMSAEELHQINHHLIHFMSHDRITLAGTMISIGILYSQLAWHGQRYGLHWARTALNVSAVVGFSSFFLYLGYGYFDPLHALAAAALLPLFALSMRRNADRPSRKPVNTRNDKAWRLALWGQLMFVALGIALAVGGLTIATVGVTSVFVPSDLEFLGTTRERLQEANPRLVSLIAHDRAGFGGALLCDALAILIAALWGISQGARWLWLTLLLGGIPGFYAAFSVHYGIGYTDFLHLLPPAIALALYAAGLALLYPYMVGQSSVRKAASRAAGHQAAPRRAEPPTAGPK